MPTQGNAMAKKAAERMRREAPSTQKRENESNVTPDAETFKVIFADNGEAGETTSSILRRGSDPRAEAATKGFFVVSPIWVTGHGRIHAHHRITMTETEATPGHDPGVR